jgi:hypothetical protein
MPDDPRATGAAPAPLPACRAHGHTRYHHAVRADLSYGMGAWFWVLSGASAAPKEISFRCSECDEVFETTRDPAVLHEFRRWPYVDREATDRQTTDRRAA